jgi:hypothetical protein
MIRGSKDHKLQLLLPKNIVTIAKFSLLYFIPKIKPRKTLNRCDLSQLKPSKLVNLVCRTLS